MKILDKHNGVFILEFSKDEEIDLDKLACQDDIYTTEFIRKALQAGIELYRYIVFGKE